MNHSENRPDYLYNPEKCPCPRGEKANCPNYRNCEACIRNHHSKPANPYTACEKKAINQGRGDLLTEKVI